MASGTVFLKSILVFFSSTTHLRTDLFGEDIFARPEVPENDEFLEKLDGIDPVAMEK